MLPPYAVHQTSPSLLTPVSAVADSDASASHPSNALKLFSVTLFWYRLLVWQAESMDGATHQIPFLLPSFRLKRSPSPLLHSLATLLRDVCAAWKASIGKANATAGVQFVCPQPLLLYSLILADLMWFSQGRVMDCFLVAACSC